MSSSRQIGVTFERQVAKLFQRWFSKARRGLQYQAGEHCPDIVKTPFYIECKRGKNYLWDGHTSVRPHNEADMAWLYGNVCDKEGEWDGHRTVCRGFILIVWKLTDKKYCRGRKHIVRITMATNDWRRLNCWPIWDSVEDSLCTVTWKEFAKVLDKRYEVKG